MNEDKNINLAEKIEKLIVDGQKEVVGRLVKLEEEVSGLRTGQDELRVGQEQLSAGQEQLSAGLEKFRQEVKTMHTALKNEIVVTGIAVQETVKDEINRVERKLDAHLRQPAHA